MIKFPQILSLLRRWRTESRDAIDEEMLRRGYAGVSEEMLHSEYGGGSLVQSMKKCCVVGVVDGLYVIGKAMLRCS